MKTNPASVHFRAKAEFSLNYDGHINMHSAITMTQKINTYKPITRMYPLTSFSFRNLDNPVPI